jgi:pimeloyl-ACP methyl ester carboxylesterase
VNIFRRKKLRTCIFVHGAWGAASEFKEVTKFLSTDHSAVRAVDLPGHGGNYKPPADVTMDAYVQAVIQFASSFDEKVTLVGHSMGGFVISHAAEFIPDKIDRLIYIAALLPKSGESSQSLMQSEGGSELLPHIHFSEDRSTMTLSASSVRNIMLNDISDEERLADLMPAFQMAQPTSPFAAPANLSQENFGSVAKYYIRTTLDKVVTPALQERMIAGWPIQNEFVLTSGHFPFHSMPDQLAKVVQLASGVKS